MNNFVSWYFYFKKKNISIMIKIQKRQQLKETDISENSTINCKQNKWEHSEVRKSKDLLKNETKSECLLITNTQYFTLKHM